MNDEKDIIYSDTVRLSGGKILRTVDNLADTEKIIAILNKKNLLGTNVVGTAVFPQQKNTVEHDFIKGIIHSEEYTESMAYDVSKIALQMSVELEKEGIYAWDLLPHNFTFNNGKWILYDFEALSLTPGKIKAETRGFFKIVFSSFEFTKKITRSALKQYYLNTIKCPDMLFMIPIFSYLRYFFDLHYSLYLLYTKQYKKMYEYLFKVFQKYEKNHKKESYVLNISADEQTILDYVSKKISNNSDVFCVGELSAKYALTSKTSAVVYIDDYNLCDKIYNYIVQNNKNISIGALYPLEDDEKIPSALKYRAIYDNYAKKRFKDGCAICLDFCDVEFVRNLADFANKLLIIKTEKNILEQVKTLLSDLYTETETAEINGSILITAKDKKKVFEYEKTENSYKNFNRGYEADAQTKKIKEILRKNK